MDLAKSKASSLLKRSAYLSSRAENLSSVAEERAEDDFFDLVGGLSFLGFFSGGAGDLSALGPLTTPITETLEGSTSSSVGWVLSTRFASLFSFLILYDGVEIWARCSGVNELHRVQSAVSLLAIHGSSPFPFSLQRAQKVCPSKIAIAWPQLPLFWPGDDIVHKI